MPDVARHLARQIVADILLDHRLAEGPTATAAALELDRRIDAGLVPSASVLTFMLGQEPTRG